MVLLFDELDKISATPKGEEVQNLLVHMTDPVQNEDFEDRYLAGIPIDMSTVMYIFSANDINKIDRVLLDRFNVVFLDGYNSKEKLTIAEQFLMPTALEEVGLKDKVGISKEIIQYIIEHYAKEESGVRELKRAMEQIAQKINMLRMFNSKDFPFYIKDFALPFIMKKEHVDLFLKRKNDGRDKPPMGMYI
jgi:ATP-dependent Lon protease